MVVNVMGNSIVIGMTSGLDTLCGQAYGAEIFKMLGVFAQRSVVISHIVIVFIVIIFFFSKDILTALKQNPETADSASEYIKFQCFFFVSSVFSCYVCAFL